MKLVVRCREFGPPAPQYPVQQPEGCRADGRCYHRWWENGQRLFVTLCDSGFVKCRSLGRRAVHYQRVQAPLGVNKATVDSSTLLKLLAGYADADVPPNPAQQNAAQPSNRAGMNGDGIMTMTRMLT
jgi:hypothetical protein